MTSSRSKKGKGTNRKEGKALQSGDSVSNMPSNESEVLVTDDPMDKDDIELELEKLVFGDDAGFLAGLKSYKEEDGTYTLGKEGGEKKTTHLEDFGNEVDLEALHDADLFFLDSGPSVNQNQALILAPDGNNEQATSDHENRSAWIDSDDERITVSLASNPRLRKLRWSEKEDMVNGREYSKRLRQQFERLYPVPEWANPSASGKSASRRKRRRTSEDGSSSDQSSDEDMSIDDSEDISTQQPLAELLQSTDPFTHSSLTSSASRKKLRPEIIEIQRTKDVGGVQLAPISTLSFHPTSPILLSTNLASLLTLFHITPNQPAHSLTTLSLPAHPLTSSAFTPPTGSHILFSSQRRYYHSWSLLTGRISRISRIYGHASEQRSFARFKLSPCARWMGLIGTGKKSGGVVNVLDAATGMWICQARVEGRGGVADFAWWGDGEGLCVVGRGGQVVEYCVAEKSVVARWIDDGAVGVTTLTLGGRAQGQGGRGGANLGGDRWVAVGSESGIVNVYERGGWSRDSLSTRPTPKRAFEQLVTKVTSLVFAPDGQLLVMASSGKRDAFRLIHLPSCTVYKNWPTSSTPLGRVSAVAFSPDGGMLAVGNEQGKIRMWEVRG